MPAPALLIRNALLTDPAAGLDAVRDVLVVEGRVARVAERIALPADGVDTADVVDARGLWLWPGLVDAHVHFREPGFEAKETIRTGSLAAAAGGYTSVICEPNTQPPTDTPERVRELVRKADAEACVHVYFKAAMTAGRLGLQPSDAAALAREPRVVALSDDGDPVPDAGVMDAVCRAAAAAGIILTPHCEDSARALMMMVEGCSPGFVPGRPYANEAGWIERDIRAAVYAGCRIHVSHVSLAHSVELIERYRRGLSGVTYEVAPHHLLLCAEDYEDGEAPTVNPPLRSAADRRALCEALASGSADVVASDHAPHTAAEKAHGASGLIGLETTLGLMLTHFVADGRLSRERAVRVMSLRPAEIFGLPAGTLRPGSPADMVLIDPAREWTIEPEEFRSKSRNCPYAGWRLRGKAVAAWVSGRQAYAESGLSSRRSRWNKNDPLR